MIENDSLVPAKRFRQSLSQAACGKMPQEEAQQQHLPPSMCYQDQDMMRMEQEAHCHRQWIQHHLYEIDRLTVLQEHQWVSFHQHELQRRQDALQYVTDWMNWNQRRPRESINDRSMPQTPESSGTAAENHLELLASCCASLADSSDDATSKDDSSISQIQELREKVRAFINEQIALEESPDAPSANRLKECYRVHRLNQVRNKGKYIAFVPEDSQFQSFSEIRDYLSEQQSSSKETERTWTACEDYVWRLMSIDLTKGGMEEEQSSDENEIEL
jgi:hypothetical protein